MASAPASANACTCRSGRSIMRCTSSTPPAPCTCPASACTISGPMVMGGTKCPSITSTWMTRAPASMTSATWAPSREKSADRIDGATCRPPNSSRAAGTISSHRAQHRVAAMLAEHVLSGAHPGDRLVLAAVRTLRDELVAPQAVDAPEATGQLRGPQPRLAAARARGPLQGRVSSLHLARLQPRDKEPLGAIAVGPRLQAPRVVARGELRRLGGQVGRLETIRREELANDIPALLPRDRAGRIGVRLSRLHGFEGALGDRALHAGDAVDQLGRLAPAGIRARAEGPEV